MPIAFFHLTYALFAHANSVHGCLLSGIISHFDSWIIPYVIITVNRQLKNKFEELSKPLWIVQAFQKLHLDFREQPSNITEQTFSYWRWYNKVERTILHSDLNNCYASIELLHRPELRGQPLAVGGDVEARTASSLQRITRRRNLE